MSFKRIWEKTKDPIIVVGLLVCLGVDIYLLQQPKNVAVNITAEFSDGAVKSSSPNATAEETKEEGKRGKITDSVKLTVLLLILVVIVIGLVWQSGLIGRTGGLPDWWKLAVGITMVIIMTLVVLNHLVPDIVPWWVQIFTVFGALPITLLAKPDSGDRARKIAISVLLGALVCLWLVMVFRSGGPVDKWFDTKSWGEWEIKPGGFVLLHPFVLMLAGFIVYWLISGAAGKSTTWKMVAVVPALFGIVMGVVWVSSLANDPRPNPVMRTQPAAAYAEATPVAPPSKFNEVTYEAPVGKWSRWVILPDTRAIAHPDGNYRAEFGTGKIVNDGPNMKVDWGNPRTAAEKSVRFQSREDRPVKIQIFADKPKGLVGYLFE